MLGLLPQPFLEGRSQKEVVGSMKGKVCEGSCQKPQNCVLCISLFWIPAGKSDQLKEMQHRECYQNLHQPSNVNNMALAPLKLVVLNILLSLEVNDENLAHWYKVDVYKRTDQAGCNRRNCVVKLYSLEHLLRDSLTFTWIRA